MIGMTDFYLEEGLGLRPLDSRQARTTTWPEERLGELRDRPSAVHESGIEGAKLPRLVMFHDSFGMALMPFMAEHFSRGRKGDCTGKGRMVQFPRSYAQRRSPDSWRG
jgi:hypothetical protein